MKTRCSNGLRSLFSGGLTLIFGLVLASSGGVAAAELGDPAPPLKVSHWIQGKEAAWGGGKVYALVFWSTTDKSARAALPKLVELKAELGKNFEVIGVSDQDPETVRVYVEKFTKGVDFPIVIDDRKQTHKSFVVAFKLMQDPAAFLIDADGRVAWFGHVDQMAPVARKVVAGKYAVEASRAEARLRDESHELLNDYFKTIMGKGDAASAQIISTKILELGEKYPMALVALARNILIAPGLKFRDLDVALRAAKRANELTEGKDPEASLFYGKALFENGHRVEATTILEQLKAKEEDPGRLRAITVELERFKTATPLKEAGGRGESDKGSQKPAKKPETRAKPESRKKGS